MLAALAEETDYDNFKAEVHETQGPAGAAYQQTLKEAWSATYKLQKSEGLPTITNRQIDAILPFLERFEARDFSPGAWDSSTGVLPNFNGHEAVSEFVQTLYDHGWVTPAFDWTELSEEAMEFANSPDKVRQADLPTILKLLTAHVRADRFSDGHFAQMLENGHISAILNRLQQLRG